MGIRKTLLSVGSYLCTVSDYYVLCLQTIMIFAISG